MALRAHDAEQLDVDATGGGVAFTTSKVTSKVVRAYCKVETAQIRIMTDPDITLTAGGSEGSPIKDIGDEFYVYGSLDMLNFKAIRTGSTSGKLNVIYEGAQ
jgi:hypothetical protein